MENVNFGLSAVCKIIKPDGSCNFC